MEKVDKRDLDDIIFAQKQIRRFAEAQLGSIKDIELETMPVSYTHLTLPTNREV